MADRRPHRVRRVVVDLPSERPAAALVRGSRLPAAAIATLALLVFAVLVLAPGISNSLNQRQQVADLSAQVAQQRRDLAGLTAQRARWSDPAYIRAQAGSRLFYVLPGETTYRVTGGASKTDDGATTAPSKTVQKTKTDWSATLLGSLIAAGTTDATPSGLSDALPGRR